MKAIATLVTALLTIVFAPTSAAASAGTTSSVSACSTEKDANSYVTRIQWASGATTTRRNLTARTSLFPGVRELWRSPFRRHDPRIVACRVLADDVVVVRTGGGARYGYSLPVKPVVVQPVDLAPTPAAPPAAGTWDRPVVLVSSVDPSWGVVEAAAAWNAALPADRQIAVATECVPGSACIPVKLEDFSSRQWQHSGIAYWNYSDSRMTSCSIGLNENVQVELRPMTLAHEVGHCLGLPHWTTEGLGKWTIMSESGPRSEVVSAWDLAWLASVYSAR